MSDLAQGEGADGTNDAKDVTVSQLPKRWLLRQRGVELRQSCQSCVEAWTSEEDLEKKFLSLDTWMRRFDGEPLTDLPKENHEVHGPEASGEGLPKDLNDETFGVLSPL
eukprot:symbB.v1.2.040905.t1/scaffold7638.1/size10123/1